MNWSAMGAILLALAVILGAFGAHGLRGRLDAYLMSVYEKAVFYHFIHAIGLLVVPILARMNALRPPAGTLVCALLLAGIVLHCNAAGNGWSFNLLDVHHPTAAIYLIMAGFILNAAVPPLHAWLPDAYGEATFNGSVFMCAFTTKTAVYALCRGFAGMEILVPLGVIMALYGVVYAVLENDCRKLLAYHIISQVGYMVAGVGLGTQMAINGACAHAFAHIPDPGWAAFAFSVSFTAVCFVPAWVLYHKRIFVKV